MGQFEIDLSQFSLHILMCLIFDQYLLNPLFTLEATKTHSPVFASTAI